jgi:membrane-bound inhibitor of C-type lysozyme
VKRLGAVLTVLGGLGLAACAERIEGPDRHVPPSGSTVTYDCDDGKTVTATFQGLQSVTIVRDGAERQLRSVVSESGAKYKTGTTVFHTEDGRASLETEAGTFQCVARR